MSPWVAREVADEVVSTRGVASAPSYFRYRLSEENPLFLTLRNREANPMVTSATRNKHTSANRTSLVAAVLVFTACFSFSTRGDAQTLLDRVVLPEAIREADSLDVSADFNKDGISDIAVFNPLNPPAERLRILSGADGTPVSHTFKFPDYWPNEAPSMAIGDVDGDDRPDIVLGAHRAGEEGYGHIAVYSGATGRLLALKEGVLPSRGLGYSFTVVDLNGDGRDEIVASTYAQESYIFGGQDAFTAVFVLTFKGGELQTHCVYDTGVEGGSVEAIVASIVDIEDQNRDGVREIVFSMPNLRNNVISFAGALFFIDGASCEGGVVLRGKSTSDYLGTRLAKVGDLDGDGVSDLAFSIRDEKLVVHSGKSLEPLGKEVMAPSNDPEDLRGIPAPIGDLNLDGFIDFIATVYEPKREWQEEFRLWVLSGKDSSPLGDISLRPYAFDSSDPDYKDTPVLVVSSPRLDRDKDTIPDIVVAVGGVENGTNELAIHVIAGSCPREAETNILVHREGLPIPIGPVPFSVVTKACGLPLAGVHLAATAAGQRVQLQDDGKNGDALAEDKIYSGILDMQAGSNTVGMIANVSNGGAPLTSRRAVTLEGRPNYLLAPVPYEWILPVGHTKLDLSKIKSSTEVTIPFEFSFYGRRAKSFTALNTGLVFPHIYEGQQLPKDTSENERMPSEKLAGPAMAMLWGKLKFGQSSAVYSATVGPVGNRQLVLTYEAFEFERRWFDQSEISRIDYQLILSEATGKIRVNYKRVDSSSPLNNRGASITTGIQASPSLGLGFSHLDDLLGNGIAIEYTPQKDDGSGGNEGGGGGDSGGGTGGGGNGGGTGGGSGSGGGGTGGGTGGEGNGGDGQISSNFTLSFSFVQSKAGATLSFDVQSSNASARAALNNCTFAVYGGEGPSDTSTNYRLLGSVVAGGPTKTLSLKGFSQRLLASKSNFRKGGKRRSKKLFLRAGAMCPARNVDVSSVSIQIKGVTKKRALLAKRWLAKLRTHLKKS